mmetsp:Transcript_1596/g.4792  ORF Transcript_1596/g.4792 Transcript_1596/m.4792 type:complete len:379 (-) Transcript_1596:63-1199(-)
MQTTAVLALLVCATAQLAAAVTLPTSVRKDSGCVPPPGVFVGTRNKKPACFDVQASVTGGKAGTVCVQAVVGDEGQSCLEAEAKILPFDDGYLATDYKFGVFADCSSIPREEGTNKIDPSAYQAVLSGLIAQPTLRVCLDSVAEMPSTTVSSDCCKPRLCVVYESTVQTFDLDDQANPGDLESAYIVGNKCADVDGSDADPAGSCELKLKCDATPSPTAEPVKVFPFVNEVRFRPTTDGSAIVEYIELAGSFWNSTTILRLFNEVPPDPLVLGGFFLGNSFPPSGEYGFVHYTPDYFRGDDFTSDGVRLTIFGGPFQAFTWQSILPDNAEPLGAGPFGNGLIRVGTGINPEDFTFEQISYASAEGTPGPNPGQTITYS